MSFEQDIKQLRTERGMTQQQVADALHVSRQTVSTWERGKNYPSLDVLKNISELFDVSFEQLLFGGPLEMKKEQENVAQVIDKEVSLKRRYKKTTIALGLGFVLLIGSIATFAVGYVKGEEKIDRWNPFLSYQVSYAKYPGDEEILKKSKKEDVRWTGWFSVNDMGSEWLKLKLATGLNHGVKDPYVMVHHKGTYVKEALIVPGGAIDKLKKNNADFVYNYLHTKNYPYVTKADRDEMNSSIRLHDLRTADFPGYMTPEHDEISKDSAKEKSESK